MTLKLTMEERRAVESLLSMGEELAGWVNEAYLSTGGERGSNYGREVQSIRRVLAESRKVLLS